MGLNAVGNTLLGLALTPAWVLGGVFVAGLGAPAWSAGRVVLLQTHAPAEVRGRVFALLETLSTVVLLPTWMLGGWAADQVGARTVMVVAPLTHVAIGAYLWLQPRLRGCRAAPDSASAN